MISTKERIVIQDLMLAEPKEQHAAFHPETDISDAEWKLLRRDIYKFSDTVSYIEMCGKAEYLKPGSLDKLPSKERYLKRAIGWLGQDKDNLIAGHGISDINLRNYFFLHKLLPEDSAILSDYNSLREKTMELLPSTDILYSSLLFPNILREAYDDDLVAIEKHKVEQDFLIAKQDGYMVNLAKFAAYAKVIAPEILEKDPISVGEWKAMKAQLQTFSNSFYKGTKSRYWNDFLDMAFNMQIIAADKITFNNGKIEIKISEKKEFAKMNDQVPEWRRF
jgi:hypothetical protein